MLGKTNGYGMTNNKDGVPYFTYGTKEFGKDQAKNTTEYTVDSWFKVTSEDGMPLNKSKKWHIEFLTGGELILKNSKEVDIQLVGGGGGGSVQITHDDSDTGWHNSYGTTYLFYGGAGGQGGTVTTYKNIKLNKGSLSVEIGGGGTEGKDKGPKNGGKGGTTKLTINGITYTAEGGNGGTTTKNYNIKGQDGIESSDSFTSLRYGAYGGNGGRLEQGNQSSGYKNLGHLSGSEGGNDGGGKGGYYGGGKVENAENATTNSGSGGGGGAYVPTAGAGGCGIVIIRNARDYK